MKYWIIPCNLKVFRVHDYFANNQEVDWKQSHYTFQPGDIVFIYCSLPEAKIKYMTEVIQINIPYNDSIKDEEYWGNNHIAEIVAQQNKYVRLRLIETNSGDELDIDTLISFGLKKAPQGAQAITGDLLLHILSKFDKR